MKKMDLWLLTALLVLCLCACAGKTDSASADTTESETTEEVQAEEPAEDTEQAQVVNPITNYDSLDEINDLLGSRLTHPGVMGVTDVAYTVIATEPPIGQYDFEVGGLAYTLRFSADFENDISGVYSGEGTVFSGHAAGEMEYAEAEDMKLARWANTDGQYVLTVTDNGEMDEAQFESIADEMQELTNPAATGDTLASYYASLEGSYYDSYSGRATADVAANGEDGLSIKISWGNSAFESYHWDMTAKLGEDGLLSYTDCHHYSVAFDANGNETDGDEFYTNGEGFFTESDGKLLWNGAADEGCESCVFVKE